MTCFKTTLLAASALTMITGAALADDNKAYIDQNNTGSAGNVASILQKGSFGGSQAGLAGEPGGKIDQKGQGNTLTITQDATLAGVGGKGNLKVGTSTVDPRDATNFGGAGVDQYGSNNRATVDQKGADNTVGSILQTNNTRANFVGNTLEINQESTGNNISYVGQRYQAGFFSSAANSAKLTMTGRDNGNGSFQYDATKAMAADATVSSIANGVWQTGAGNQTDLTLSGNENRFAIRQSGQGNVASKLEINGDKNELAIAQTGTYNQAEVSTIGANSGGNSIGIKQNRYNNIASITVVGGGNDILTKQDGFFNTATTVVSGFGNGMFIDQTGTNDALVAANGNENYLNVKQNGFGNAATVKITGNNNNFANNAKQDFTSRTILTARLGQNLGDVKAGDIYQDNGLSLRGNTVDLTVNSSNNLFATYQNGRGNTITGTIGGGNGNQAFVAQIGNGNMTDMSQTGAGNILAVVQK